MSGTTDAPSFEETRRSLLAKAGLVAGVVGAGTLAWPEAAQASTITGWVNVKDPTYGATGDGSTNDRNAIQNALNDAAGAVCYFPPGTYLIGSPLRIGSNTILRGCGRASVLKGGPGNPDVIISNVDLVNGNDNITIEYLEFDGNRANRSSSSSNIQFEAPDGAQCHGITIHRVVSRDCKSIGMTFVNVAEAEVSHCLNFNCDRGGPNFFHNCNDIRIHHNHIHSCGDDLIALNSENPGESGHTMRSCVIANNELGPSPSRLIAIAGARECVVEGNLLYEGTQGIIVVNFESTATSDVVIQGNVFQYAGKATSAGGDGILISAGFSLTSTVAAAPISRVLVSGNIFDTPARCAVEIQSLRANGKIDDVTIEGNQILFDRSQSFLSTIGRGITSGPATDTIRGLVIEGNVVYNASTLGIAVFGANHSRVDLRNNNVYNSGQNTSAPGITISSVADVSVVGNRCQDTQTTKTQNFGIRFANPIGGVEVIGNDCPGNASGPISFIGSAGTARLRIRDNPGFSPWTGQITIGGAWSGSSPPFTKQSATIAFGVPFPSSKPPRVHVTGEDVNASGVAATVTNVSFVARLAAAADLGSGNHKASWTAEPDDD